MIKYIQDKSINYDRVKKLLAQSAALSRFSNGGPVKVELETHLHKILKLPTNKRVVVTNNGTSALHALMFMFEEKAGKKMQWGTIAYNFPSIVVNNSNTLIFDIDPVNNSYAVPQDIVQCDGVVIPTLFGTIPSNIDQLENWCKQQNKILIYDNASSPLGVCRVGDACFGSMHHTKYLGFGEGGFAVVEEQDYNLFDSLTSFGFFQTREYKAGSSNFKLSDVCAAFILSHMEDYSIANHLSIQWKFVNALKAKNIIPFNYTEGVIYGNLPICFDKPTSHLDFRDFGIEANKYYLPLDKNAINSWNLYERMVNFPLHSQLTDYEVNKIVEQIAYMRSA